MSDDRHTYTVDLKWNSERKGQLSSEVLESTVEVATPPEFPGGMEGIWSPEHLFISSVSSCFMTTFLAIAEYSKLDFEQLDIQASGTVEKVDGKFMVSKIVLSPTLLIPDESVSDKAERILEKAEKACLITRSIKSEVELKPQVKTGALN